jgi:uncharacterized membrane protein YdjX (TVP38/TMEM64 family)
MTSEPEPRDSDRAPTAEETGGEALSLPWKKILWLGVAVTGLLALAYLSPLRGYLGRVREVSEWIRSLGLLAPLVLTFSVAVLVAIGLPRLLFCVIAGMALGFWPGLLWAQLGTLLGNYAVFLLVRWHGRGWAEPYVSRRGRLHRLIRQEGITGVVLARQVPVPGLLINVACGLLPLRHRDYLIGTALGQLPEAVPCTLIGAGVIAASFAKSVGVIGLAVLLALVLWLALRYAMARQGTAAADAAASQTNRPGKGDKSELSHPSAQI